MTEPLQSAATGAAAITQEQKVRQKGRYLGRTQEETLEAVGLFLSQGWEVVRIAKTLQSEEPPTFVYVVDSLKDGEVPVAETEAAFKALGDRYGVPASV